MTVTDWPSLDPYWYRLGVLPGTEELPFGIHVGHTWHEIGTLFRVIQRYDVKLFIEIGVHRGGLAALLLCRSAIHPGFGYLGVEIDQTIVTEAPRAMAGERIFYGDCFSDKIMHMVRTAVENHGGGRAMIYCDNGNKPKEIAAYADVPRPGDLIGTHDYWDPTRDVRDFPGYGIRVDTVRPEVLEADLAPLRTEKFRSLPAEWLKETRLAIYERVV